MNKEEVIQAIGYLINDVQDLLSEPLTSTSAVGDLKTALVGLQNAKFKCENHG